MDVTSCNISKQDEIYLFIKGYAMAKNMTNTLLALSAATRFHEGQLRKSGSPYIIHPLRVALHLINLDVDTDEICAAAILHDTIEDCNLEQHGQELITEYGLTENILNIVLLLTKEAGYDEKEYYENLKQSKEALIIKLSDRANNCATLSAFTEEKMKAYVNQTESLVYPLCVYGKTYYPELSNAITIIKYQLVSICETIESLLDMKDVSPVNASAYKETFFFIKGYARGKGMNNTLIALSLAERYHKGQLRNCGDPFIIHPLRVCSYLISLKLDDDEVCAAALLHEILKKCNLPNNGNEIVENYGISKEVLKLIYLVSKKPNISKDLYYENLKVNAKALLIKLSNRANTCTHLISCSREQKLEYLTECDEFIYPLCEYGESYYPNYSEQIDNMRYHISSVAEIVSFLISSENHEETKNNLEKV